MVEETMRRNLYDAATKGEVARFLELVEEDPYLLDVVLFPCSRNLLHIATMWGQAGIVEEVLKINPKLAWSLEYSQKLSPLHIAAAEGYVEIASKLSSIAPDTCWWRNSRGMNPIHVAAVKGHAEFLEALVPHHLSPAREKVDRGQTVLHLCVKHGQLRALQVLVNNLGELVHVEDEDGEPILHLAVRNKQLEIVEYLTENTRVMQEHLMNSKGKTALLISKEESPEESEITKILNRVVPERWRGGRFRSLRMANDVVMVVLVLIAGMAFQAAIDPPGGVWQDDSPTHKAGTAIMGSNDREFYEAFVCYNTAAFISSMLTIFLLAMGTRTSWMVNGFYFAAVFIGIINSMFYFYMSFICSVLGLIPERKGMYPSFLVRPLIISCLAVVGVRPYFTYVVPWFVSAVKIVAAHPRVVVVRDYRDYLVTELTSRFDAWRSSNATATDATDAMATDAVATDATTTDATATDVTATDATATDVTATDATATDATVIDVTDATATDATDAMATDAVATDATTTDATATDVTATDATATDATVIDVNISRV